ncbi:DNRLRE domain-containing protein [Bacillus salitolerans]|uniref:DNRLRE domain-containing protein n=1 Tax=Bacillus salitolerans TaxID=1437434 RepID=A0ABW4LP04_9BACI
MDKLDVKNIVNKYLSGSPNYGFAVMSQEQSNYFYLTAYSSEYSNVAYRPQLVVSYNNAPEISLTTANGQVLSELSGNNNLQINGNVMDVDTGDNLLIKYSIDNLSGHQNKILP